MSRTSPGVTEAGRNRTLRLSSLPLVAAAVLALLWDCDARADQEPAQLWSAMVVEVLEGRATIKCNNEVRPGERLVLMPAESISACDSLRAESVARSPDGESWLVRGPLTGVYATLPGDQAVRARDASALGSLGPCPRQLKIKPKKSYLWIVFPVIGSAMLATSLIIVANRPPACFLCDLRFDVVVRPAP